MSKYTKSYIRSGLYFRLFNTLITRFDCPASTFYSGFARISITFLRSYVNIIHSNLLLLLTLVIITRGYKPLTQFDITQPRPCITYSIF